VASRGVGLLGRDVRAALEASLDCTRTCLVSVPRALTVDVLSARRNAPVSDCRSWENLSTQESEYE